MTDMKDINTCYAALRITAKEVFFMKKTNMVRLTINALLVAVYFVLSLLIIQIGGFKITFEHFPVVLCAVLFGPVDAMVVGGLGELINQLTSFGLTPTTVLWILPIVARGLLMGMAVKVLQNKLKLSAILEQKFPLVFGGVCIVTGVVSSCLNTLALYVDSKMFGYYNYALVFGSLLVRVLLGVVTSIVITIMIKPVLYALKKAHLI